MDYYDVFTEKFDDLPVVMDNYKQLTDILRVFYGLLRVYYGMLLFIKAFTTCLRVATNTYGLVTSIYESLRFFAKNYINRGSSCNCTIVQSIISGNRGDFQRAGDLILVDCLLWSHACRYYLHTTTRNYTFSPSYKK